MERFISALVVICIAAFAGFSLAEDSFGAGAAEQRKPFSPFQDVYEADFGELLKLDPEVAAIKPPKSESTPFDKSGDFLSARESPRFMFAPGTNVFNPGWQVNKLVHGGPSEEYSIARERDHPREYSGGSADLTGVIDLFLDLPVFATVPSAVAGASGKVVRHKLFIDRIKAASMPNSITYYHRIEFLSEYLRNGRLLKPARTPEHFKELIDTVWNAFRNFPWASVKSTRLSSDARFIIYDYQFQYCTNWSSYRGQNGHLKSVPRRYYRNAYRFVLKKKSGKVFLIPTTVSENGEEKAPCRIVDLSDSVCYLRKTGKNPAEAAAVKRAGKKSPRNTEDDKVYSRCCADSGGSWNSQQSCCSGASYNRSITSCPPDRWFRNCDAMN